jgi:hypothetical protein
MEIQVSKATPGPWLALHGLGNNLRIVQVGAQPFDVIADVRGTGEAAEANARLLAAAPALRDALREMVRRFESCDDEPAYVARARAALAACEPQERSR